MPSSPSLKCDHTLNCFGRCLLCEEQVTDEISFPTLGKGAINEHAVRSVPIVGETDEERYEREVGEATEAVRGGDIKQEKYRAYQLMEDAIDRKLEADKAEIDRLRGREIGEVTYGSDGKLSGGRIY